MQFLGSGDAFGSGVCEAYYYNKQVKYHLDYQTLMAHRAALGCKRLILTHVNDDLPGHMEKVEAARRRRAGTLHRREWAAQSYAAGKNPAPECVYEDWRLEVEVAGVENTP